MGTVMTMNNNCTKEVDNRISEAWKVFYQHRKVLMCRKGSLRQKLSLLERWVLPALTYNIGTLNLTQRHLQRIRRTEATMQRRVCRWKFPESLLQGLVGTDAERAANYMQLVTIRLMSLREKWSLERWDMVVLSRVYDWAGHVARFQKWAPERYALRALLFRDIPYLKRLESEYGHQMHYRKFKVWRWEQQFVRFFGLGWKDLAISSETWAEHKLFWQRQRNTYTKM